MRSNEDLLRELEEEKRARHHAVSEAETQGRFARAIDRLSTAILTSDAVDELLGKVLEILVEATRVEVAVLRLREGDRLRSRAAVGLEEEVAAGFSLPIDEGFAQRVVAARPPLRLSSVEADEVSKSAFVRRTGVGKLYCLPLVEDQRLVGAVYLGVAGDREFTDEDQHLVGVLGARAASALVRHTERDALRQAIRSRDEVLAVVAHDLQNPLNVISLAANTLLPRLPDSSARRTIERIIRGAQRADRLIHDLLEINAIESGQFAIQRHPVEAADLILSALESQQSLAADASIIIAPDLSPELPPIDADAERILEVLENLIGNALKFTSSGGSITVGAKGQAGEIVVWVKDSGAGISSEELPHIFDRFWQARKAERRGTGLGLTICKGIVEAHGGRIWAESELGVGTTMFFSIPSTPLRTASDDKPEVASILLVDDRPENLLALKAILDRPEYRLVTAASGEEALGLALRESFSVALIDIAMPGMSGLEVATHLKELERSRDIPIIFVTAFGNDPEEIHRAYSAGGADYLVKPLDIEIVRKKVAVFVDLSRRRDGNERPRRNGSGRT